MQLGKENIAGILSEALWISLSEAVRYIDPILAPVIEAGVKSLLELTSEHTKLPEDEIKGHIKKLRNKLKAKLKSLGIPKDMESQLFETLNFVLIKYGGEPLVRGVNRSPKAYANAVVEAAGGAVPADVRETVSKMLEIFYEEIFKDNTLGRLVSMEIVGDLARKIDTRLLKAESQLRLLEPLLPERQAALLLKRPWEAKPPGELSFASLTAWAGVVPFKEVPAYTALLQKLQNHGPGLSLNLVVGEGGSGKTRLGFELARALRSKGWMTGALPSEFDAERLSGLARFLSIQEPKPKGLFILIDYAGERSNLDRILAELFKVAEDEHFEGPVAVLMLERRAEFLKPLTRVFTPTSDRNYQYAGRQGDRKLREALQKLQQDVIELKKLDEEIAKAVFFGAYKALREQYEKETKSALPAEEAWAELKEKGSYPNRPLALVLAAYLAVQGQHPANPNEEALLAEALMHEKEARWWPRLLYKLGKSKAEETQMDFPYFEVLIAGATLLGYLEREEALPFLKEHHIDRAFFTVASSLLPLKGSRIGPLEPDPVADFFLRKLWENSNSAFKEHLAELFAEVVRQNIEKQEVLSFRINRASQVLRRAKVGNGATYIKELISFWIRVFHLSKTTGETLVKLFYELYYNEIGITITNSHDDDDDYDIKFEKKPKSFVYSPRASPLLAVLLYLGSSAAKTPTEQAWLQAELGGTFYALGLYKDASKALKKATSIYRIYRKELGDYLFDLIKSLNDLGRVYLTLHQYEEALKVAGEALHYFDELRETKNIGTFVPDRAMTLLVLSYALAKLNRHEEALTAAKEAVEIYRNLSKMIPEALLPNLAMSLYNLGNVLSAIGDKKAALEATKKSLLHYQELAKSTSKDYTPEIAGCLNNLADDLFALGRHEEAIEAAQEAVKLYRELAERSPEIFHQELAMSLNNLARILSDYGRHKEALSAVREGVNLYQKLAESDPELFLLSFAASLTNLGNILSALGHHEEALKAIKEGVQIRRKLARKNPNSYLPNLAKSLNDLAGQLSALDLHNEALKVAKEALQIDHRLAKMSPEDHLTDLAASLNSVGYIFFKLGRLDKALDAMKKAVEIDRVLSARDPETYQPSLATSLNNLGNVLSALGHREKAIKATKEAIEIYRESAKGRPAVFLLELARSLDNLARDLSDLGHHEDAYEAAAEAAEIYSELETNKPKAYRQDRARNFHNLGYVLFGLGRYKEAHQAAEKAIKLYYIANWLK